MRLTINLAEVRDNPQWDIAINHFLEGLTLVNVDYLREHPDTPRLYDSGVLYRPEPPGEEEWLDIPTLYARGIGDCEDVSAARAAELRRQGIRASAKVGRRRRVWIPGLGPTNVIHIMVQLPGGRWEDPSAELTRIEGDRVSPWQ